MTIRRPALRVFWAAVLGTLAVGSVKASPIISYTTCPQFATGLSGGYFIPSSSTLLTKQFPTVAPGTTTLSVVDPACLVAETTGPTNTPVSGGIMYDYKLDPDLRDLFFRTRLNLPRFLRPGLQSGLDAIAFAVVDINERARFWGYRFPDNPNPGEFSFRQELNQRLGGPDFFGEDAGFDLSLAQFLQVGYVGEFDSSYPLSPNNNQALWLSVNRFIVETPEPGTWAALGAFTLTGFGVWRRRTQHRTR